MSEMFEMGLSYPKGLKCFNWAKLSQNALNFANVLNFPAGGIRAPLGTCSSCIKYWFLFTFRRKNAKTKECLNHTRERRRKSKRDKQEKKVKIKKGKFSPGKV